MGKIVYVLEAGCIDDYHYLGVFSTEEKAQKIIDKEKDKFYKSTMHIVPVEINKLITE